jgi:hypothetical protein
MTLRAIGLGLLLLWAGGGSSPALAAESEGYVIRCESKRDRDNYCTADTSGGVILRRTLSKADCVQGDSWDFDRTGIWVRKGCRAEFDVPRAYSSGRGWSSQRGYGRRFRDGAPANQTDTARIVCESRGATRVVCPATAIKDVDLVYERSRERCRFNVSWGFDATSIWVEQGCRAEFLVN